MSNHKVNASRKKLNKYAKNELNDYMVKHVIKVHQHFRTTQLF